MSLASSHTLAKLTSFSNADYVSPQLTQILIQRGAAACSMKDKKGWLPAHVAASRHCSPEKLRMLLDVYPQALVDETDEGYTLLSLAKSTATASHPNFVLIDMLVREMKHASRSLSHVNGIVSMSPTSAIPAVVSDEVSPLPSLGRYDCSPDRHRSHPACEFGLKGAICTPPFGLPWAGAQQPGSVPASGVEQSRRQVCDDRAVGLLLHFSQSRKDGDEVECPRRFASVKHVEV
jgi:hypothetical protein